MIVSNRVPVPRGRHAVAGGLAVALKDAIQKRDALWFGWSGHTATSPGDQAAAVTMGRTTWATLDLTPTDLRHYYDGYANGTLWPLLHSRVGLAIFAREDLAGYRRVNAAFAAALVPLLRPDDTIWIHDFHLFPLAAELRQRGCRQRIGFFLHIPFPPPGLFAALPRGDDLLRDLAAFDLIGVQTEGDAVNLGAACAGVGVAPAIAAFPIGIDVTGFARLAARAVGGAQTRRLAESMADRALILGADRLDYTKGLPQRFRGYARLLQSASHHRRKVTFLQVAPLSRGDVAQYRALRRELDELAGRINGQHGDIDWIPIRWITRAVPRNTLAGFHRIARVGLVTPLADGMNLVAKEFVAAQDPADPGVLVLSRFAGAAAELSGALVVNPHDPDEIAEALDAALVMPREERLERWRADRATIGQGNAAAWADAFLRTLAAPALTPEAVSP